LRDSSLVLGLDGRADVDGGQGGEDIRLDRDDDDDLEEVEASPRRDRDDARKTFSSTMMSPMNVRISMWPASMFA
jgi:hypothetical protein